MDNDPVKEFARWVIREGCFEGYDLDGGQLQDKAVELGLLREETYDPEKHPNVSENFDAEEGDRIFVFTELVK